MKTRWVGRTYAPAGKLVPRLPAPGLKRSDPYVVRTSRSAARIRDDTSRVTIDGLYPWDLRQ